MIVLWNKVCVDIKLYIWLIVEVSWTLTLNSSLNNILPNKGVLTYSYTLENIWNDFEDEFRRVLNQRSIQVFSSWMIQT